MRMSLSLNANDGGNVEKCYSKVGGKVKNRTWFQSLKPSLFGCHKQPCSIRFFMTVVFLGWGFICMVYTNEVLSVGTEIIIYNDDWYYVAVYELGIKHTLISLYI